jgi:hypothetical protein
MGLPRDTARTVLLGAQQVPHEGALDLEEQVGGLQVGGLTLGVGTLEKTPAFRTPIAPETRGTLAQVGLGLGPSYPSPTRFWLDARGVVYAETDLEEMVPVARTWREFLDMARKQGGRVGRDAHHMVAAIGGWDDRELVNSLELAHGHLPRGLETVVWERRWVEVCHPGVRGPVLSAGSLEALARALIEASKLFCETTADLLDRAPKVAFTQGVPPELYRARVDHVLGVVRSSQPPRRTVFIERIGGGVDWWTLE